MDTSKMTVYERHDYYESTKKEVLLYCPLTAEEILTNTVPDELARAFSLLVHRVDLADFTES